MDHHVEDNDEEVILALLRVPSYMFAISTCRLVEGNIALHNDLGFVTTFFLSLGSWRIRPEDLHLLYPSLSSAQIDGFWNFWVCLEESISETFHAWDPHCNGVSKMLENVMDWKKQVTEIYPVLLNLRSDQSLGYVSRSFLHSFIRSTITIGVMIIASMPVLLNLRSDQSPGYVSRSFLHFFMRSIITIGGMIIASKHVLLNLRCDRSPCYVSRTFLHFFFRSIIRNGGMIIASKPDLDAIEKKTINAVMGRLRFLRNLVHLAENESMQPVLTLIQKYARKAAHVLFLCWTGEIPANKRYELLSDLQNRSINDDEPCSTEVIILDVLRVSKKMLMGEGIAVPYIDDEDSVKLKTKNLIWEYIAEWVTLLDDHHNIQLLHCNSRLKVHLISLHDWLRFSSAILDDDLSIDMKVMIVQIAACLGLVDVFQLGDQSEEEVDVFNTSVLVTFVVLLKVEFRQLQLMKGNSCLIIVMTDLLKQLENNLRFLKEYTIALKFAEVGCTERNILLLSHCESAASGVLSFFESLEEHKMEKELSMEMGLAFFKVFGITNLMRIEIYLLFCLKHQNVMAAQVKDRFECLYDKLKFLLEFLENLDEFAENQKLFLLDTVLVVSQLTRSLEELTLDETDETTEQMLKEEGNPSFLKFGTFELLVAELMLNTLLTDHVDLFSPFDKLKTLRNGLRLLRIMSLDSIEPYTEDDKLLCSESEVLARIAVPRVCNLFRNKSNEGMASEMNRLISDLTEKFNGLETDVRAYYVNIWKSSQPTLPRIDGLRFLSFLVDKLSRLMSHMYIFSSIKYEFQRILNDLIFTTSLLKNQSRKYDEDDELNSIVSSLTDIGYEVENVAELFIIEGNSTKYTLCIYVLADMINQMGIKISDFLANMSNHTKVSPQTLSPRDTPSMFTKEKERNDTPLTNKVIVGMGDEVERIINNLTRGTKKRDIVSIVGMGGIGKTTLAQKVYNDPLVQKSFNVCAWCCISKVYHKRALLLKILGFLTELTDEIKKLTDDDLSHKMRKLLLGRRYLIVMDDIWDIGAWKDLKNALPDEGNGSRILFTSRVNGVAKRSMSSFVPCFLSLLSQKESSELLDKMLFQGEGFPIKFRQVGQEIAVHCRGLPLAIVVISGVLETGMNLDWWKQVAGNLKSFVVGDSKNFTNIIDLSFHYLPDHLKPCFLYFGAFQEDEKVYVSNLVRLWTAEGLVQTSADDKSLSDVAKDYLMELVSRNLVIVAERTSMDGGIKACRVHDLLHEICRAQAEEANFLRVVNYLDKSASDLCPNPILEYQCRRLCVYSKRDKFIVSEPSGQRVRSFLYFAPKDEFYSVTNKEYYPSFILSNFKLLSTLNLDCINSGDFLLQGIETLIHLRFLAVRSTVKVIPDSIARLCFLETFLVKGLRGEISLPYNVWSMYTLRHLHVKDRVSFSFSEEMVEHLSQLDNLETLSSVFLPYEESSRNILQRLPRLKKLKCIFSEYWDRASRCNRFPVLVPLVQLESLKVVYHGRVRHPSVFSFPANLKKLTLSKFRLPWKEISVIGSLRCLEVMKLLFKAFEGEEWEVGSEEFQNLKYLKLDSLGIVRWTASYESFPCLQQIVLQSCKRLEEVPFAFGESPTLQTIQAHRCSKTAVKSVRGIQDEQFETLARKLNVLVHPPDSYLPPF